MYLEEKGEGIQRRRGRVFRGVGGEYLEEKGIVSRGEG